MGVRDIVLAVVMLVSAFGTSLFVLLQSGDDLGISDAVRVRVARDDVSSEVIERNLKRITLVCVCVFIVSMILAGLWWPKLPIRIII
jgi:preprotein translocase subunit SecG